jgi:hypothetical protein
LIAAFDFHAAEIFLGQKQPKSYTHRDGCRRREENLLTAALL